MQLNTHRNKWVQYISQPQHVVQSRRDQDETRTSIVLDQPQEISSPYWEVEENTNITVFEETEENYLRPFEYVEAQMNVLDEVPQ
jgi:hypothetical protein